MSASIQSVAVAVSAATVPVADHKDPALGNTVSEQTQNAASPTDTPSAPIKHEEPEHAKIFRSWYELDQREYTDVFHILTLINLKAVVFRHRTIPIKNIYFYRFARFSDLIDQYKELSKFRLTSLVALSTLLGYVMAEPFQRTSAAHLASTCGGTFLAICSANSINQLMEVESDRRMARTTHRLLPTGRMSRAHAMTFAAVSAVSGVGLLWLQTNPVTTALAAANIALYTAVYTPLKKLTVWNTWVGAVVGAIPPLIGSTAVASGKVDCATVAVLCPLLYLWQIPHFLSLSYYSSEDYETGGYKMYALRHRDSTPLVSLVHTYAMFPLGYVAWHLGMTRLGFVPLYTALNGYFVYCGHVWLRERTATAARKVFFGSLTFLTASLVLLWVCRAPEHDINREDNADVLQSLTRGRLWLHSRLNVKAKQ